jgi:hypothetical protein
MDTAKKQWLAKKMISSLGRFERRSKEQNAHSDAYLLKGKIEHLGA